MPCGPSVCPGTLSCPGLLRCVASPVQSVLRNLWYSVPVGRLVTLPRDVEMSFRWRCHQSARRRRNPRPSLPNLSANSSSSTMHMQSCVHYVCVSSYTLMTKNDDAQYYGQLCYSHHHDYSKYHHHQRCYFIINGTEHSLWRLLRVGAWRQVDSLDWVGLAGWFDCILS